ncbi:vitamin D 25-hydroxylase-like [Dermacentor albipictus]|uniref:vitamin D 25-hydroxylase-like n=1 Tax=Dermacentor albipictus TaxID=60249 RepID=UPI0038FC28FB
MWFWIAIGVLLTVTLLTALRNGDKDKRLPPGPSGLPILGYLPFIKGPYHVAFKQLSEQYGPLVRLRLGLKDVVVLNDLPSIREALANPDVLYRPDNFIFRELGYIVQNLQGNVANIYGASTNPVRRTILWCLYIAAADPDGYQATLQREIDAIVGSERTPQWEYRHRMPLTMAFILETLRWRTISPISVHRVAGRDTILSGYHIPAGTFVVPNLWSIHNDSTHWRRPYMFDPVRFLKADGTEIEQKPQAFLPFSLGRRACPGETLALTEIFLYVTTLLQKFRVLPEEGKLVSLASGMAPRAAIDHTQRLLFVTR